MKTKFGLGLAGLLAGAGLCFSSGCKATDGEVRGKFHQDAQIITITIHYRGIPIPIPIFIPEENKMTLQQYDSSDREMKIETYNVSRNALNATCIGDWYTRTTSNSSFLEEIQTSDSIREPVGARIRVK